MYRSLLVCAITVMTVGFEARPVVAQQRFTSPAPAAQAQRRAQPRPPTLSRLSTSPTRPVAGQPFTFGVIGTNIADTLVEVVFTGPGCEPCVVPNEALSERTDTRVVGPATLNTPGTYYLALRHGASAALSNNAVITVSGGSGATGSRSRDEWGLSLNGISTSPATPSATQPFNFTLTGQDLSRRNTQVVITGPGCDPCIVPPSAVTASSSTRLSGSAMLNQPGVYSVAVREGANGTLSRNLPISVVAPPPSLSSVTTSPQRPQIFNAFTFRLNGANIDADSVQVVFTGPGCSPCVVPASDIDAATPTRVTGQARLENPGTYQVALRHGAGSPPSANLQVVVGGGNGRSFGRLSAPSLTRVNTSPAAPRAGETFAFRLAGEGFRSDTVEVLVTGPGCSPCTIANEVLSIDRNGRVAGSAMLNLPGRYEFTARNGRNGPASGALEVVVR